MTELCEIEPMIEDLEDFKGVLEDELPSYEDEELLNLFAKASKSIGESINFLNDGVKFMKARGQTY